MSFGPPGPRGPNHIPIPTPDNGKGKYGVYSRKDKKLRAKGLSKKDAEKLAKGWNKGEKKRRR